MGHNLTKKQLEDALNSALDRIQSLSSQCGTLESKHAETLDRVRTLESKHAEALDIINKLQNRLAYYENADSPPSARSLPSKKGSHHTKSDKKPGGQPGHRGASRKRNPTSIQNHDFADRPRCGCGRMMITDTPIVRDIIDIKITTFERRHIIRTARCDTCGTKRQAPHDLPKKGNHGKTLVSFIGMLRASRVPFARIADIVRDTTHIDIAKSTIINCTGRICDTMRPQAGIIRGAVRRSGNVGIDETSSSLAGKRGWTWVMQSRHNICIIHDKSRNALVMDRYMDRYNGIVTSDKYPVYGRFDHDDRHQLCWAHELRALRHASHMDGARLHSSILYKRVQEIYHAACTHTVRGAGLRHHYESRMRDILFEYRNASDDILRKSLNRLATSLPHLFVFLEHENIEPTNNSSERALRYVVVSRKISGQIKGGQTWQDRWSWFMTCVLTWNVQGRSFTDEVFKIV